MSKKVTSKDIAQYANVSQATVSYVLNNAPGKSISESTRKRVLDAVTQLNYIPNSAAKRLKSKNSFCIAVRLATTLMTPRYYIAIQGIRSYLEAKGYSILLCNDQKRGNTFNYIDACVNTQADGIIYIASNNQDIPEEALEQIKSYDIPFSAIDCMSENPTVNSITYDYFASSYRRADWLLKKGAKKFIYVRPDYENPKETARERGFLSATLGHDDIHFDIVRLGDSTDANSSNYSQINYSSELGKSSVIQIRQLINASDPETYFICSSREVQQEVTQTLYYRHLITQSPKTNDWYEHTISYHFPHYDAGFEAARSLLNLINNHRDVRKLTLEPILEPTDPDRF